MLVSCAHCLTLLLEKHVVDVSGLHAGANVIPFPSAITSVQGTIALICDDTSKEKSSVADPRSYSHDDKTNNV